VIGQHPARSESPLNLVGVKPGAPLSANPAVTLKAPKITRRKFVVPEYDPRKPLCYCHHCGGPARNYFGVAKQQCFGMNPIRVVDVFTNLVICVNIDQTLHGRHHRVLGLWLNNRTIALDQNQLGNLSSCVAARVGEHIVKKPEVLTQAEQFKCQLCKHTRDDRCSLEAWEQDEVLWTGSTFSRTDHLGRSGFLLA
jgi:hypothetical protein